MKRLALCLVLLPLAARAQTMPMPSGAMPSGDPAGHAMMSGMERMNQAMSATPMTGNPDHDFMAMMIPHHQGAIDMAKSELQFGKDPKVKRLARAIIAAQETEIAQMRRWLASGPPHH